MNQEGIQFEHAGVALDHEIKGFISSILEKIYSQSPSDAVLKVALKSTKNLTLATCKIVSQTGVFIAEASNTNPLQAIMSLEQKIKIQFESWRADRF
jgi:hypothetical protein